MLFDNQHDQEKPEGKGTPLPGWEACQKNQFPKSSLKWEKTSYPGCQWSILLSIWALNQTTSISCQVISETEPRMRHTFDFLHV